MGFKNVQEANEALAGKSKRLHEIFEQAGVDIDLDRVEALKGFPDTRAKAAEIKRLNAELSAIGQQRDDLADLDRVRQEADRAYRDTHEPAGNGIIRPGDGGDLGQRGQLSKKSIGRLFVESAQYKQFKSDRNWASPARVDLDLRAAVFRTGAGWDPEVMRIDRVELSAQRPIAVVDHIPMLPTGMDTIQYMKETTFTNNAVETAESTATTASDLMGEAALALTATSDEVEWLPVFIPVTIQQMEDVEGIEAYVDMRLSYMLRARLDLQIIQGTGVSPLLLGTNALSAVLSQAKGADPTPDAVYKAMTQVRATGFAEPSVVFAHPNDWQDVRLLRTADGIYIWGSPADAGPDRIWGVPVVQTTAALENTMTLGDYRNFSTLFTKRGITLAVSDSHAFYFTRGMLAIRADMRVAMVHFRDTAFCKVTGV